MPMSACDRRDELVRANSLELLDNVLDPELRQLLVPLLDSQVSTDERIAIANRLVGAPLDTAEQAVETLLSSEDPWLRSSAIYAVGALQLHSLEGELTRFENESDPVLKQSVRAARRRLKGEPWPRSAGTHAGGDGSWGRDRIDGSQTF